jgi:hypothetical protein
MGLVQSVYLPSRVSSKLLLRQSLRSWSSDPATVFPQLWSVFGQGPLLHKLRLRSPRALCPSFGFRSASRRRSQSSKNPRPLTGFGPVLTRLRFIKTTHPSIGFRSLRHWPRSSVHLSRSNDSTLNHSRDSTSKRFRQGTFARSSYGG